MKANSTIRLLFYIAIFYCPALRGQTISGVINSYYQVTAINTLSNTVSLNTAAGLSPGTRVLIIQMKGAAINSSNTSSFGDLSAINDAGNYEFNTICSINGNDAILQYQFLRTYNPAGQVQLVSVPVYNTITINGTLTANPWDPVSGTGGIVALEASGTIFLNGDINVSGMGFQGGILTNYPEPSPYDCSWFYTISDYFLSIPPSDKYHTGGKKGEGITDYILNKEYGRGKLANGGGGGNSTNTGGGGGANYGTGGNGGQRSNEGSFYCHGTNPGIGGLSLSPYGYTTAQNKIFMGGGGGGGHENNNAGEPGGNGGGIVILTAQTISGTGFSILADGVSPVNPGNTADIFSAESDGGGGGGAGGTIILNAASISGSITASANGAKGSNASNIADSNCMGPGGGGGGGAIWAAGSSFPAAVTASENGGSNGVISNNAGVAACRGSANGATAGANGIAQPNYQAPVATNNTCVILAASDLLYFKGSITDNGAELFWEMNQTAGISSYAIASSVNRVNYTTIGYIDNEGAKNLRFTDPEKKEGTVYYRLQLIYKNGDTAYSEIVGLTRIPQSAVQLTGIRPNPVTDHLDVILFASEKEEIDLLLYNAYGQKIQSGTHVLNAGYTYITIPAAGLPSGIYFLFIKGKNIQEVKRFIKQGPR